MSPRPKNAGNNTQLFLGVRFLFGSRGGAGKHQQRIGAAGCFAQQNRAKRKGTGGLEPLRQKNLTRSSNTKKLIATAALLLLVPILAPAQNAGHVYHAEGYGFVAEEGNVGPACGGGGEGLSSNGFGLGGEYVKEESPFSERIISANLFYRFGSSTKKRKYEPFVTDGYTLFSIPGISLGPASGGNLGVGSICG